MSILVATDLTARSDRALQRAALMAAEAGEPLIVVHVLEEEWSSTTSARNRGEAENGIAAALAALRGGVPESLTVTIVEGKPHEALLRQCAQIKPRLIVLGTRHQPSTTEMFLGTTVDNLARRAEQPILLVRDPVVRAYLHAVVGIDFSSQGIAAAKAAMELFPDCSWRLVHAYDVPFAGFQHGPKARDEAEDQSRRQLHELVSKEIGSVLNRPDSPAVTLAVGRGEVVEVLCREVKTISADLLVTGTHGRAGIAHAILGSVAETVLARPPCDVLVVRSA